MCHSASKIESYKVMMTKMFNKNNNAHFLQFLICHILSITDDYDRTHHPYTLHNTSGYTITENIYFSDIPSSIIEIIGETQEIQWPCNYSCSTLVALPFLYKNHSSYSLSSHNILTRRRKDTTSKDENVHPPPTPWKPRVQE